ncbi:hypothetical protein RCH10_005483 [Variovorax sp. GrIS 2.14]|jgi:hypothetical protein
MPRGVVERTSSLILHLTRIVTQHELLFHLVWMRLFLMPPKWKAPENAGAHPCMHPGSFRFSPTQNTGLQGCCRNSRRWSSYGDGGRRQHGRADCVQGCTGVCSVGRTASAPDWHRWTGTAAGHQQARRCLPANAADARYPGRRDPIQGWSDMAMADRLVAAPAASVAVAAVANKLARTIWAAPAPGPA